MIWCSFFRSLRIVTPISTCRLNLAVLFRRQGPGLLEHVVVDADLADVMEQASEVEVAPFWGRHSQFFGQPDGNACHPLRMPRGIGILGIDGSRQARMIPNRSSLRSA